MSIYSIKHQADPMYSAAQIAVDLVSYRYKQVRPLKGFCLLRDRMRLNYLDNSEANIKREEESLDKLLSFFPETTHDLMAELTFAVSDDHITISFITGVDEDCHIRVLSDGHFSCSQDGRKWYHVSGDMLVLG